MTKTPPPPEFRSSFPCSISRKTSVSIVIALFNGKKYIESAIDSVLNQTLENFELFIIDDCSTDDSYDFVRQKYSDPRIKFFRHEKNMGCSEAINDAIRMAHGKYLQVLAQDDALIPTALDTLYKEAEHSQADILHTTRYFAAIDSEFVIKKGLRTVLKSEYQPIIGLQTPDFRQRFKQVGIKTFFPEWLNFCRLDFLRQKKIFIPDVRLALDVFFLVELLLLTERFVKVDAPVYCYRRGSTNSITNSSIDSHFRLFLRDIPHMILFLDSLFAREDVLTHLNVEERTNVSIQLLRQIFHNSIVTVDQKYLSSEMADTILMDVISQPKFYSRDFMHEFLKLFCTFLRR